MNIACILYQRNATRIYYYYSEQLNGYVITDIPAQVDNRVTWVYNVLELINTLLKTGRVLFMMNKDSHNWLRNHTVLVKEFENQVLYEYIGHSKAAHKAERSSSEY